MNLWNKVKISNFVGFSDLFSRRGHSFIFIEKDEN
jgi:hypothetical protein